nr:hypothetical protein [Cystobacter fuscus]
MILAVATLGGHTLGQVLPRVKSLPRFNLAGKQFEAQGGASVMGRLEVTEASLATEGALAQAVAAVDTVATSPQGPLAVVMLKKGQGRSGGQAPGGRFAETVIRHRGGNRQVELSDGQRWHVPRGKSAADIPVCVHRSKWNTDSVASGTLIPEQVERPFRPCGTPTPGLWNAPRR